MRQYSYVLMRQYTSQEFLVKAWDTDNEIQEVLEKTTAVNLSIHM